MCRATLARGVLGISIILALLAPSCGEAHAAPPRAGGEGILERVPPSRPAPMWDQPLLKPHFDNSTSSRVIGAVGRTAYLHCRVKHLGDRAVTWIRKQDVHVLTVGLFTYTTDDRFTALHSEGSDDWTLRIASAQISDSGTYECQISTEPKMSRAFKLQVVEAEAHVVGPREIHMVSGSNINLTCSVTGSPEPPQYIYWYRGITLINYSSRGGISVVTDKHSRTSRLVVIRATTADSGNYTCAPANAEPASVSVYILNGEHPAAMQGGDSTSVHCQSLLALLLLGLTLAKFHELTER
ncbi:protein amalgam isoform X2 [Procambarus clarkii]|uniref:protein amalgam isoform X2 n=1 Tax=Procambarus clarkii TaxID=6728 RepID=UPI001E676858|nr:hemicentin-2-like isoform X2 [Procambarus clarkii]